MGERNGDVAWVEVAAFALASEPVAFELYAAGLEEVDAFSGRSGASFFFCWERRGLFAASVALLEWQPFWSEFAEDAYTATS